MAKLELRDHNEILVPFSSAGWMHYDAAETLGQFVKNHWGCDYEDRAGYHSSALVFDTDADLVAFMLLRPWENVPWK